MVNVCNVYKRKMEIVSMLLYTWYNLVLIHLNSYGFHGVFMVFSSYKPMIVFHEHITDKDT